MIRGRLAEPFVADWYAIDAGIELYEPTEMFANGVCLATLDRLPVTPDGTAIEIKTTAKRLDGYPERYWTDQAQMQTVIAPAWTPFTSSPSIQHGSCRTG